MEGQITLNEWMQWKEDIRRKLRETASNFVYIGYRLKQIRDSGMFDGCSTVYEFAQKEYGLERSTVSRFMAINDKFSRHGNSIELRDEFVGLSQSQLSEMLTLPVSDYELVTENTAIKDIRELKKFEKDAMNPPEEESEKEESENVSTMQGAINPDSGNEPQERDEQAEEEKHEAAAETVEPVATSQQEEEKVEYTPLQKCIIDFFRDKLDLLREISNMTGEGDEKLIAEAIAPSGCTTHRKGIIFLTMQDYDKGVKYKQMGVPLPISMSWEKFAAEIDWIFLKGQNWMLEENLKQIYPESVQKAPENVQKNEKIDKKPQKTEKIDKEQQRAAEEQPKEETAPAADPVATSHREEKGTEDTADEEPTEDALPAAEQKEIQQAYRKTFGLIREIEKRLGDRKWEEAYAGADTLAVTINWINTQKPEEVNAALDAEFDND